MVGPNSRGEHRVGRPRASSRDRVDAQRGQALARSSLPIPHSASVGRSPITVEPVLARSAGSMPRGLPNPVAILARSLLSPMPTEQCSPVALEHRRLDVARERLRVVGARRRGTPRPSRAPRTDDVEASAASSITRAEAASYAGASTGRNTASGHFRRRGAQRHPGADAELARLVRRGGHHAALGRVAAAADHDRQPGQLRPAQHLDRGDELVEVDVQHPVAHRRRGRAPRPCSTPISRAKARSVFGVRRKVVSAMIGRTRWRAIALA